MKKLLFAIFSISLFLSACGGDQANKTDNNPSTNSDNAKPLTEDKNKDKTPALNKNPYEGLSKEEKKAAEWLMNCKWNEFTPDFAEYTSERIPFFYETEQTKKEFIKKWRAKFDIRHFEKNNGCEVIFVGADVTPKTESFRLVKNHDDFKYTFEVTLIDEGARLGEGKDEIKEVRLVDVLASDNSYLISFIYCEL